MKQILTHRFAFHSCSVIFVGRVSCDVFATPQYMKVFMMQNMVKTGEKQCSRRDVLKTTTLLYLLYLVSFISFRHTCP